MYLVYPRNKDQASRRVWRLICRSNDLRVRMSDMEWRNSTGFVLHGILFGERWIITAVSDVPECASASKIIG